MISRRKSAVSGLARVKAADAAASADAAKLSRTRTSFVIRSENASCESSVATPSSSSYFSVRASYPRFADDRSRITFEACGIDASVMAARDAMEIAKDLLEASMVEGRVLDCQRDIHRP